MSTKLWAVPNAAAGAVGGLTDGGVAGGLSYAASGQPLTPGGLVKATAGGAALGGMTGGVSVARQLTKTARAACFVAGTQVLMGDGTSKAIENVAVGDQVLVADIANGETVAKPVVKLYVHEGIETWSVETSSGLVTATAEHPFYVEGRGWTPVHQLCPGDRLVDEQNRISQVLKSEPTGQMDQVFNFHVGGLNNYHVATEQDRGIRVHNTCTPVPSGPSSPVGSPTPLGSPNFVVHSNGEAVIVPTGAQGPLPVKGNGVQYTGGSGGGKGLDKSVDTVRIMDPHNTMPHPQPTGYVTYMKGDQVIDRLTGKTLSKSHPNWHWRFK